ncbi:MAG: RDD family protein [Gammaproteobacteria bacterium]|nr:RDD family protein [Gammaproteobacteria bacterium]
MQLDTTQNLATPEGVELRLPVAGLAPRALAWLVDALIKAAVIFTATVTRGVMGGTSFALYLIVLFFLLWFYNVLFEVFRHGATPGKSAVGIRVVNANGTPVGWTGSLIRNLIRNVDLIPGVYLFGFASLMLTEKFQRLGDLAASTIVVYDTKNVERKSAFGIAPEPLRIPLTLEEQQTIVSFAERTPELTGDRAAELASIVEPVLPGADAQKLCAYASWLTGREQRT